MSTRHKSIRIIENGIVKWKRVSYSLEDQLFEKEVEIKRLHQLIDQLRQKVEQLEEKLPKEEQKAVAAASTYDCYK
jgi:predicted  nucleic acid-binding Zn-ribbon protein